MASATLQSHNHSGLAPSGPVPPDFLPPSLHATLAFAPFGWNIPFRHPASSSPTVLYWGTSDRIKVAVEARILLLLTHCDFYINRVLSSTFPPTCSMNPCTTSTETLSLVIRPTRNLRKQPKHQSHNVSTQILNPLVHSCHHLQSWCSPFFGEPTHLGL